jgi:lysophospholipase L1-like esterase
MPLTPGRKKYFVIITALLSLFFVLLAGEILVRFLLPFNTPDTVRQHSIEYVPSLFARFQLRPIGRMLEENHDKAWGTTNRDTAQHQLFINELGFRGPSFMPRKPEGIQRIAIFGGSSVFDANSKDYPDNIGRDWPHRVERFLRQMGHAQVEIINVGVPGYATFDSLGRLYSQVWMYEPDFVLLYNGWNDVKYFRLITPEEPLLSHFKPLPENGNPFIYYSGWLDRLLSYSQLYIKFRNQYYSDRFRLGTEGVIPEGKYQDTYSPHAVKQYRLNVQLFIDAARNIGATPILITQPTLVSPHNSDAERQMIRYDYSLLTHDALVRAIDETYDVIRGVAKEKQAPLLELAPAMNGKRELFIDNIHLSEKGSDEVAMAVAKFVAPLLRKADTKSETTRSPAL